MAGLKIPIFEKGSVLTHEMLEVLKKYTIDISTLNYTGYSDGILNGCEVTMSDNMICVNRGIVVFNNQLFLLPQDMKIMVNPGREWQILNLCIGNMSKDKNFMTVELRLELTDDSQEYPNKLEICRFRLQNGARLRNQYRDFQDMCTEFDTVNEIYAKWSSYHKNSISNRVLKEFAKEAITKKIQNQQDICFVQQILALDGKTLNRDVIIFYLNTRLGRNHSEMTNLDIYRGLQEVLKNIQRGGFGGETEMPRAERRILID